MSKNRNNNYSCLHLVFDAFMTIITGGGWLVWVAIVYLRKH